MLGFNNKKYSPEDTLHFLHKIYNAKFNITLYKFKLCLLFIMGSQKHYIPLSSDNIYDIVKLSVYLPNAEGENFIYKLNKQNDKSKTALPDYYKNHRILFILFLIRHLKQYVLGEQISSQLFVKFYFRSAPSDIAYSSQGRSFIDYSRQISQTGTIFDNADGSGLSAGYFDRVFLYFKNHTHYGENILVLKPIDNQKYRLDRYECLGDRFIVIKDMCLSDPNTIKYILSNMSDAAKKSFFECIPDGKIEASFGQIDSTIQIMNEIDPIKYRDSINYLSSLMN